MAMARWLIVLLVVLSSSLGVLATAAELEPTEVAPELSVSHLRIMVVIPEWHISHWIPDPAAETAIIGALVEAGYRVVDQHIANQVRANEQLRQRILGDPQAAAEIGLQYGADIIVTGEAFSEDAGRVAGMRSCRARVEIRAVRCQTAEIIAALSTEAGGADIAESIAAKKALRNAGDRAYRELEPRLRSALQRPATRPIMITVSGVDFDSFSEFQSLVSTVAGVLEVVRPQLVGSSGSLEVIGEASGSDIGRALSGSPVTGGTVSVNASSDERLSCAIAGNQEAKSLEIHGLTFDEAVQVLNALKDQTGPENAEIIEYAAERSFYRVSTQSSLYELVDWLVGDALTDIPFSIVSVTSNNATLDVKRDK